MTYTVTIAQVGQQGITGATGTLEANAVNGDFNVDSGVFFVDVSTGRVGVGTETPAYALDVNGSLNANSFYLSGTEVTVTATELNLLDGVTASTAELNLLDGVTATTAELNKLDGVTTTTAELNILDGVTATAADLNILTSVTRNGDSTNTVVGNLAAAEFTTGSDNVVIGNLAMANAVHSEGCVFIGQSAGLNIATGSGFISQNNVNVAIGLEAMRGSTSLDYSALRNIAVGFRALGSASLGTSGPFSSNTAVGDTAGYSLTSGEKNLMLGSYAGTSTSPFNVTTQSNRIVLGDNNITNAYVRVSWTVTSDERDKTDFAALSQGLDVVDAIDTFTFKFDNRSSYFVYDEDGNIIDTPAPDGTHKTDRTFVGFKAQQVQAVLDAAGFPSDVVVDTEDPENLKMKETALIPLLINAIKELKARVEALESGA